jgi:hypothetical protein
MPNFAMSGTADFSAIESKLQALQNQINSIKVPPIKVADPNLGNFFSAMDAAEKKATIHVKTVVDNSSISGGFSGFLNSEKGKFSNVGRELGQNLTMGMQQQFGAVGGMAGSVASARTYRHCRRRGWRGPCRPWSSFRGPGKRLADPDGGGK